MKPYQLILAIFLFVLIGCKKENTETIITGKIIGNIPNIIEYTLPIDGITFFGFKDSIQPDSLGNFEIRMDINKPSFIEFFNTFKSYGTVVAEPNMNYTVLIDIEDKKKHLA